MAFLVVMGFLLVVQVKEVVMGSFGSVAGGLETMFLVIGLYWD